MLSGKNKNLHGGRNVLIWQINDWLYGGNWDAVRDVEYKAHGIGAIVCVAENDMRYFPESGNNVNYLWCSFNDPGEQLTAAKLEAIVSFCKTFKDGKVFIFCHAGSNRSPAIQAVVLNIIDGIPIDEACRLVESRTPTPRTRSELSDKIEQLTGLSVRLGRD